MERLASWVILQWGWKRALLAIAAGAIGTIALPPLGFFAAMFVSFTLLVWLLDGAASRPESGLTGKLRAAFMTGWLFGLGYFVGGLWWIGNALLVEADQFAWALPLAVLGLPAVLAIYFGLAAMFARLLWSEGVGRIAALAAGFAIAEWLRSWLLTGFPWNTIGYGAMPMPLMMQSAHYVGILGVTVAAVFVFSAPALIGTRRGMVPGLLLAAALFAAHLGYGAYRLSEKDGPVEGKAAVIRLVQPVIDQAKKMDDGQKSAVFEEHLALTTEKLPGSPEKPDIIIWPETSVPFILTDNRDALKRIADILDDNQFLVAGAVREEDAGAGLPPRYYNSIQIIDGSGNIIGASDKVHLVPFGEYVPFESTLLGWGIKAVNEMPGGFSAAVTHRLLELPGGRRLYPLICYEAIFPDEISPEASGASALLNVTNDAWFGNSPGPYQHFQQARIRAVETGIPLIRSGNNGISALVNSRGEIISGLGLNVKGAVQATLGSSAGKNWTTADRSIHFWLIVLAMILVASFSRVGFNSRMN
nr:apolipoprotein N-acyltransferase [uncultured Gellertiella sp.]